MPSVSANGMTIEYDVRGDGEPILFVMGLGGQLIDWPDEFVDLFVDQGYQAIRFDNRDAGLSSQTRWTPPSRPRSMAAMITRRPLKGVGYTMADMADDAAGLLHALGIEAAHVVGASMGAMIAQELAINHPGAVRSLCSIMGNTGDRRHGGVTLSLIRRLGRRPPPTLETAVEEAMIVFRAISGPHFDEEQARKLISMSVNRAFDPAAVARQTAAIGGSPDRTPRLGSVTAPTLVIHGMLDPLVKPDGGLATAAAIPGSRLVMYPDMGHDLPLPRWAEIRDTVVANLRRGRA